MKLWILAVVALFVFGYGQGVAQDDSQASYAERFETAWRLVEERYWDQSFGGVDWQAVREEYKPRALQAQSEEAFYDVLENMYAELGDHHSVFVPPNRVQDIRQQYGDLPCLGLFSYSHLAQPAGTIGNVSYELIADTIGYLKVPDLATPSTANNVRQAVQELEQSGVRSFILDLRGNPGGRLIEMMQTAGIFTSGFLWRTITRWTLPLPYPALGATETELPLVVLIDGDVNSAAEGLAGALKASGRATVIGQTSAGNVEAVLPFCLRDGSQAWIATGVLAPLRGATWEGRGVEPDITTEAEETLEAAVNYLQQLGEEDEQ